MSESHDAAHMDVPQAHESDDSRNNTDGGDHGDPDTDGGDHGDPDTGTNSAAQDE